MIKLSYTQNFQFEKNTELWIKLWIWKTPSKKCQSELLTCIWSERWHDNHLIREVKNSTSSTVVNRLSLTECTLWLAFKKLFPTCTKPAAFWTWLKSEHKFWVPTSLANVANTIFNQGCVEVKKVHRSIKRIPRHSSSKKLFTVDVPGVFLGCQITSLLLKNMAFIENCPVLWLKQTTKC